MSTNDRYYSVQGTPNVVSAPRSTEQRGYTEVVFQSGRPVPDYEVNLQQQIRQHLQRVIRRNTHPSGFLLPPGRQNARDDLTFNVVGDVDFVANAFRMGKQTACIAGTPVEIEFTGTATPGQNLIQLDAPPAFGGSPPDVKRSDFVFLEVWFSLLAPFSRATGTITVNALPSPGDTITLNGNVLTAVAGVPAVDEFTIGGTVAQTAANIAVAINLVGNSFLTDFGAAQDPANNAIVQVIAQTPGVGGNALTLATSNGAAFILSGGTLTGGSTRPNRPNGDSIYTHGNLQAEATTYPADDLTDPVILIETSQRIQVQYRIRVTGQAEAVNFKTEANGFNNPVLRAQGGTGVDQANYPFVPADNATTLLNSDATAFCVEDGGLWIAGDGSSTAASDLQTLDGYVYGLPMFHVSRRNDAYLGGAGTGYDPINNTNGGATSVHAGFVNPSVGAIAAGTSDRPDNGFADEIQAIDVRDIRPHVVATGLDAASELKRQWHSLLDGTLRTWAIDTADKQTLGSGSGDVSLQPLVCNEVGRSSAHGGNNVTTGDTGRGVTIRNFDHVARRFGSQSVVERFVVEVFPQDRESGVVVAPGRVNPGKFVTKSPSALGNAGWFAGDTIVIDLTALNASTLGNFDPATATLAAASENVFDFAPPGTQITDVLSIFHDDGNIAVAVDQQVQPTRITGMGTGRVEITLDDNPTAVTGGIVQPAYPLVGDPVAGDIGSPRRIFVELEITYPKGVGLSDTPDQVLTPNTTNYPVGPLLENDPNQRPGDMETLLAPTFREGFREVGVEYVASENGAGAPIGSLVPEQFVSRTATSLVFLRRPFGSPSQGINVTDAVAAAPVPVDTSSTEYGSSSRLVNLGGGLTGPQTLCTVTYFARDPVPNYGAAGAGYQVSTYFRTNAPQTAGTRDGALTGVNGTLPETLVLDPIYIEPSVYIGHNGPGSIELPFPYLKPLDQIPVNDDLTTTFPGEWFFCASAEISLANFDAETGFLRLPALLEIDQSQPMTFGGPGTPPLKDLEFRAFYGNVPTGNYRPMTFAEPLAGSERHKVMTPMLARITEDTSLFRKGEVVLVVFSRFAELDAENSIRFVDTDNRTAVSVYKTQNTLITISEKS